MSSLLSRIFGTRYQKLSHAAAPDRYYGDGGTIHHTGHVDIEVDANGVVVSCWFRCQMLPFRVTTVGADRAADMRTAFLYKNGIAGPDEILTGALLQRPEDPPATMHWSE